MMMADGSEILALWLGQKVSAEQGSATQEILFTDIAEQVEKGASFDDAVADVTKHDPRAGDFGVEVVGSLVAVALLNGLKAFWAAYAKELEEKAGKSLADITIDFIKARFRSDIAGPAKPRIEADLTKAVTASGANLGVQPAELQPALAAVQTTLSSSTL
jgi:hypothetical protein